MTEPRDPTGRTPRLRRGAAAIVCATAVLAVPGAQPAAGYRADRANVKQAARDRADVPAQTRSARHKLRARLGRFAVLSADPATGAVRQLARLDGTLTGATQDSDAVTARRFAETNRATFGLSQSDVAALRLDERTSLPGGGAQLTFSQRRKGVPALDFGLRITVDDQGRVLAADGSPRPLGGVGTEPQITAAQAYRIARDSSGDPADPGTATQGSGRARPTTFASGERASLVLYGDGAQVRLGWRVFTQPSGSAFYDTVVDASSGTVHSRANLVSGAEALVHDGAPGTPGVTQAFRPIDVDSVDALRNAQVHAFLDVDDQVPRGTSVFDPIVDEEFDVPAADDGEADDVWDFRLRTFDIPQPESSNCTELIRCSWVAGLRDSWERNQEQSAVQLFAFVDGFLTYLGQEPISFGSADGAFGDGDRILAQAMDGANRAYGQETATGLPDVNHQSNASILVLPDGSPSYLQSYLFDPTQTPTSRAVSSANDPSIVYHEVAHAMIHRLVTDAQGYAAVSTAQAGAIDEGLADFYALDHLVQEGKQPDEPGPDVTIGSYSDTRGFRTQPIDAEDDGRYTYADIGSINPSGGPEIHYDGEIVAQTVWELRNHPDLSGAQVRAIVTAALRTVPAQPSFLDLRNAILLAHEGDDAPLWEVFASRGMGYFASTEDSGDTQPTADFRTPPPDGAAETATIRGTVTELGGGPQAGVTVSIAGHEAIGEGLEAVTAADGTYEIAVPAQAQPYRYLVARGPGPAPGVPGGLMTQRARDILATAGATVTQDFALARNHASAAAGAQVRLGAGEGAGLDFTKQGCGPTGLTDVGRTVWGSVRPGVGGTATTPRTAVVELVGPITLGAIRIDPTAGCGDPLSASLGSYEVQTSRDGLTWTPVAVGEFGQADLGASRTIPLRERPAGVRFVQLLARDSMARAGVFMDTGELEVYDQAAFPDFVPPPRDPPPAVNTGESPPGTSITPPPPPPSPSPPPVPTPAPETPRVSDAAPKARAKTKAKPRAAVSCFTRRTKGRIRVTCRLRDRAGVKSATVRLSRSGRTAARVSGKVRSGRLPTFTITAGKRRTYRLQVTVRTNRSSRTITRSITL